MAALAPNPTLGQSLTRKRSNPLPGILFALGLIIAVTSAILGYLESQRTEKVVVLTRDIPYGQQISAADVGTLELPLHRPAQLAGISNPAAVVGQYATRSLGANDLVQPAMLMPESPSQPVYPNGEQLGVNMVPVPFSVGSIGPLTYRDRVNIGFHDPAGTADMCDASKAAAAGKRPTSPPQVSGQALRPFACRYLSYVRVLYIEGSTAYLEMTPYQAHTIWALQAAGYAMWGERYGITSDPLPPMERLDIGQITVADLTQPAPTPLAGADTTIPGADTTIPGADTTIPGAAQPTAAAQPTSVEP